MILTQSPLGITARPLSPRSEEVHIDQENPHVSGRWRRVPEVVATLCRRKKKAEVSCPSPRWEENSEHGKGYSQAPERNVRRTRLH